MNKNRHFWADIVVVLGLTILILGGAYIYSSSTKYPKYCASVWHEGDEVVFRNNGPRMLVIDADNDHFVVCKYYNYVKGNFITEHFRDNQLEKIDDK